MKNFLSIVRSATPSTGTQFRATAYGTAGARDFLRDVLAMANASVEGTRYIIIGADFDKSGRRTVKKVDSADFTGKPAYQALANEFIEPPVRLRYQPVMLDGQRLGVYEIGDCQDRPYMMRIDYSESLRRGDAFVRANNAAVKMGRSQLQALFELKFRESVSAASIEIGFPGEIIHKDHKMPTCDLSELPSLVAGAKLSQLIKVKSDMKFSGSATIVARLTHARLFGSDSPYENKTADELAAEIQQLERQYRNHDEQFLYEKNGEKMQLVVYNQGNEPIRDASLSLVMPNHLAFHVASHLPKLETGDRFLDRSPAEQSDYPSVNLTDDAIQVSEKLGDIPPGQVIEVFDVPLRLCIGNDLKGRKFGIQYSLFAQNLRAPAKGKLRLLF